MLRSLRFFIIFQLLFFYFNLDCSSIKYEIHNLENFYNKHINVVWYCKNPQTYLKQVFYNAKELYIQKHQCGYEVICKFESDDPAILLGILDFVRNMKYGVGQWNYFIITKNSGNYSFSGTFLWYFL